MKDQAPELNYQEFVRVRKLFRHQTESRSFAALGADESLMLYSAGPDHLFAVFEQSQQSGWFYLFDAKQQRILKGVHIYSHESININEEFVDIGWSADDSACGLALWGEFRAFLGISSDLQTGKPMTNADEEGIPSSEWPAGFQHYLEPKID